ncbi:hypothetical protein D9611_009274 [Ephemerocybe angulata]|uniref:NmrA-like domain-containing protein n=1 Tax=Ephemerocybe angulata TaxID=980116 RepID=A0A8H5BHD8_9AGAR|nr:hypothetical protein D9611_009274 [Tulosesus angulatus]
MSSPFQVNLLLTDAAGYIGGEVLSKLLDHPKSWVFRITTIVESEIKAEMLRALDVNAVVGSPSDESVLEKIAAESDIVISTAGAENLGAASAILRGLKKRYEGLEQKIPGVFIHTSSTAILTDDARGLFASEVVYDDLDVDQIASLPDTQPHRKVDLEVLRGDAEGFVLTYIVVPSTVYGVASNKLVDLGIQSPVQSRLLLRASIERGQGGMIGLGKNILGHVHIEDLAELYIKLIETIMREANPGHGKEGFYFAENGEYTFYQFGTRVSEVLVELGSGTEPEVSTLSDEEIKKYFNGSYFIGTNARCRASRARETLRWDPKKATENMLGCIKDEIEAILKENADLP